MCACAACVTAGRGTSAAGATHRGIAAGCTAAPRPLMRGARRNVARMARLRSFCDLSLKAAAAEEAECRERTV